MNSPDTISLKPFENPYQLKDPQFGGPEKNAYRLSTTIPSNDFEFIEQIRPANGTKITTVNLLWQKLVEALKDHGITDFTDKQQFEQFVANCRITDGRPNGDSGRTTSGNVAKDPVGNDRRGVEGVYIPSEESKNQSSITPGSDGEEGKKGKGGVKRNRGLGGRGRGGGSSGNQGGEEQVT